MKNSINLYPLLQNLSGVLTYFLNRQLFKLQLFMSIRNFILQMEGPCTDTYESKTQLFL